MIEEFRDVVGYEGIYKVSNLGNVKSLPNKVRFSERILKPSLNSGGYFKIDLRKDNKTKTRTVHQLVAEAFLNHVPCGNSIEVDHINEDKLNNRLDNLQLLTSVEHRGKGSSSKYIGVSWCKRDSKWLSRIRINGKLKNLGDFYLELEAAYAYQDALKAL
tara:strand:- start:305 stop:784 length:480 start_codon:yes stop_codon:yes gene_type:complete